MATGSAVGRTAVGGAGRLGGRTAVSGVGRLLAPRHVPRWPSIESPWPLLWSAGATNGSRVVLFLSQRLHLVAHLAAWRLDQGCLSPVLGAAHALGRRDFDSQLAATCKSRQ